MLKLSEELLGMKPYQMMEAIYTHFSKQSTLEEHERLRIKAQQTKIILKEIIDAYINRHRELRREMRWENYPNIQVETTTRRMVIQGISTRKSHPLHIQLLFMTARTSLRELVAQIETLLDEAEQASNTPMYDRRHSMFWCEYSNT